MEYQKQKLDCEKSFVTLSDPLECLTALQHVVKITLARGLDRMSEIKFTAERQPLFCCLFCELLANLPQLTAQICIVLLFFVFCSHKLKSLL